MKNRKQGTPIQQEKKNIMNSNHGGLYSKKRRLPTAETSLGLSIFLNVLLIFGLIFVILRQDTIKSGNGFNLRSGDNKSLVGKAMIFHGGHPAQDRPGQCWCGADTYCMCTPSLAIDLIIASGPDHLWLVRRKDTSQLATMGGFVNVGETVEAAVKRELMEEMGVDLKDHQLKLFGVYSDPRRDNRRATVSAVFAVHLDAELHPHAADDVKDVQRIALTELEQHEYFADHKTILLDYKRSIAKTISEKYGDFASDIARSTCSP